MSFSVIIPSKNIDNLVACVQAVRRCEPAARIIWVDDRDTGCWEDDGYRTVLAASGGDRSLLTVVAGVKKFIFSRNVNLGLRVAYPRGAVILGDDGLLQTPGGFSVLARAAEAHPEFGIISSTVNNVGNLNQHPGGIGLREDPRQVCFVCVYIPSRTIDLIGLMDERFTSYGFDDDDYCLRIRRAGLKIGIHDGCFVDHGSLKSTFRGDPTAPANLTDGMAIFVNKWGAHPL